MDIYFVEAHRAHQTNIPGYWRADLDTGEYYTELECEVASREAFEQSARAYFAARGYKLVVERRIAAENPNLDADDVHDAITSILDQNPDIAF